MGCVLTDDSLHMVFDGELDALQAGLFGEFHFIEVFFRLQLMEQLLVFGMLDREPPELGVGRHELRLYFVVIQ